jgi:hypothetical protein
MDQDGMTCTSTSLISNVSATVYYDFILNERVISLTVKGSVWSSGPTGFPSYLPPAELENVTLLALEQWQALLIKRALEGMRPLSLQRTSRSLVAHLVASAEGRRPW